jgi:dTDP-4-dehydrorhamnose reductase
LKILLLGKNGQVGWELQRTLVPLGEIITLGRSELDLTDQNAIRRTIRAIKPDLIVNAAAYTAVDKAEDEPELAMAVNGIAPGILAEEASLIKAKLVHYSTDYVFGGTKNEPYTEDDCPNPINVYGKTKLAGEKAIIEKEGHFLIFRVSWVYGKRGNNFLQTMLRLFLERKELKIVSDQIGAPTWSRMIAEATAQVIGFERTINMVQGVYHLTAAGQTSWHGFAKSIQSISKNEAAKKIKLIAIESEDYKTKAARPKYSVLDCTSLFQQIGLKLPNWQQMLELAMED